MQFNYNIVCGWSFWELFSTTLKWT